MIQFLLNDQVKQLDNIPPNLTVLQYLRGIEQKKGTKEGCASGDCGACTAVIASVKQGELVYESINTCITFVGTLHGKQLITVDDLQFIAQQTEKLASDTHSHSTSDVQTFNPALHTVQQAMVDKNGSQCGFCTPGIVMSLFAWQQDALGKPLADDLRHNIEIALSGNLCRCTGYQPIINAAHQLAEQLDAQDIAQISRYRTAIIDKLNAITNSDIPSLSYQQDGQTHHFFLPQTSEQLAQLLSKYPDARLVNGGTDLALEVTQFYRTIPVLIGVSQVKSLQRIRMSVDHMTIGAAVSYNDSLELIRQQYPAFAAVIERIGSTQIRNQGSIGANVANASPIGDSPPALLALNARLTLTSASGTRTMPVEDYFIDYKKTALQAGEFIESIDIPLHPGDDQPVLFEMYKVSKRIEDDISAVCGAFYIEFNGNNVSSARIAFGGMAAIPKRAKHVEQALVGQAWTQATIETAMQAFAADFSPIADVRASAQYRSKVAQNLLMRCYIDSQHTTETQVVHHA